MTSIRVDWDEWYPVYFIVSNPYHGFSEEVEILDEDLMFIRKAFDDFNVAQRMLEILVHPNGWS